jgi:hypothetical protein
MKFRPEDTTSERQLVLALAKTGRTVPLSRLTAWRKDGLLPPLASTGLGAGAGRSYYWREPDILAQAVMVHDALARHGRADRVAMALWLRGFAVPVPKLKRAWLSHLKARRTPAIRQPATGHGVANSAPADLSCLLLQTVLGAAAAMQPDDTARSALSMLAAVAQRLNIPSGERTQHVRQFWQMAQVVASALATSDLLSQAKDGEILKAQYFLRRALRFIEAASGKEPEEVAQMLGETLFLYILTLLRSGQEMVLEQAAMHIDAARPRPALESPPLYAQA